MKKAIQLLLGIGISALCVWLSMKDVHFTEVLTALRGANAFGFVLVMLVTLGGFWLRALRWRYFIDAGRPISMASSFSATMIGFMANNVLPFRLGEFVRFAACRTQCWCAASAMSVGSRSPATRASVRKTRGATAC